MTDIDPKTCTAVTVYFVGERHKQAADAYVIQFADGGMDEDIEGRLAIQGFEVQDTDFDTNKRTLTIKL